MNQVDQGYRVITARDFCLALLWETDDKLVRWRSFDGDWDTCGMLRVAELWARDAETGTWDNELPEWFCDRFGVAEECVIDGDLECAIEEMIDDFELENRKWESQKADEDYMRWW